MFRPQSAAVEIVTLALLFIWPVQILTAPAALAAADPNAGRQICQSDKYKNNPKLKGTDEKINEQCQHAVMCEDTSDAEKWTSVFYGIAGAACVTECLVASFSTGGATGGTICSIAGLAADAGGMAFAIKLANESVDKLREQSNGAGNAVQQNLMMMIGKIMPLMNALGSETQNKLKKAVGCWVSTALVGVQFYMHLSNIDSSKKQADGYYIAAAEINSTQAQTTVGDGGTVQDNATPTGTSGTSNGNLLANDQSKHDDSSSNILKTALGAGMGDVLNDLSNKTGKAPEELIGRLANGESPFSIAAESAAARGDAEGATMAATMDELTRQATRELAATGELKPLQGGKVDMVGVAYESVGAKRPAQGSESTMPDLGAMMSAFMPGAKKDEKKQGASRALAFKTTVPALEPGIHPPARSIFDVVDSRYQMLYSRFASGENVMTAPRAPAMIPENPYLKR